MLTSTLKIRLLIVFSFIAINSYAQVNHLATYHDGQGGIEGLIYPNDIEIDSSGNLYIVGNSTLTHLAEKDTFKIVSYIDKKDANEYSGLINVDEIKSTFDKRFYYLTGDHELFVFTKSDSSGELSFTQSIKNSDSISVGYGNTTNITITPDSKNLYLSYNWASNYGINIFSIDTLTGKLTFKNNVSSIKDINNIISNNKYAYTTAAGYNDTSICVFQRTKNLDSLALIQKLSVKDSVISPTAPVLSADSKFLYTIDKKTITIFEIDQSSGQLSFKKRILINDFYDNFGYGVKEIVSKDNQYLYLADLYGLLIFKRDPITGDLTFIQSIQENRNFTGFESISSIKLTKSESELIVLSKYNNSIIVFKRNQSDGKLTYYKTVINQQGKIKGLSGAVDIIISKNDKYVYTLASSGDNTIALFKRNSNGILKFVKNINWDELGPSIGRPSSFNLHQNNQYMYISSIDMYGIRLLRRDTVTGDLTFFKSYTEEGTGIDSDGINDIVVTEDSKNLYAATYHYIVNYKINPDSCDLILKSKISINEDGNKGLIGNQSIITSHDGKNVYTFSYSEFYPCGLSVYSRNEKGELTCIENYTSSTYSFLVGQPFSISISPDDKFLYAVGTSIFCFKRDLENGRLTFVYEIKYPDIGLDNLYRINDIALSKDGRYLLGISNEKKTILSFYRNSSNGNLILEQVSHFSKENNYSSEFPKSIFSHDMKNVYIVSQYDQTLSAYKANIPVGLTDITDVCGDSTELHVDKGFNYLWSTGDTLNHIKVLKPGEYSIYISDNTGREGWDTTLVKFHPIPQVNIFEDPTYSTEQNLFLNSEVTDGAEPYSYFWNDSSTYFYLKIDRTNLSIGRNLFSLAVTDKYGCTGSDSTTIKVDQLNNAVNLNSDSSISIYPNPFRDNINVDFKYNGDKIFLIDICDLKGNIIRKYSSKLKGSNKLDLSDLISGTYIIKITGPSFNYKKLIIKG